MTKFVLSISVLLFVFGYIFAQEHVWENHIKRGLRENKIAPETLISRAAKQHSNKILIGRWPSGPCEATFVSGNYAYIGNGGSMDILDINNPAAVVKVGEVITPCVVTGIYVSGNYAYVTNKSDGLRIIDISNLAAPSEVGFFDTDGLAEGVYVLGSA
jgi:hypothetical protein